MCYMFFIINTHGQITLRIIVHQYLSSLGTIEFLRLFKSDFMG